MCWSVTSYLARFLPTRPGRCLDIPELSPLFHSGFGTLWHVCIVRRMSLHEYHCRQDGVSFSQLVQVRETCIVYWSCVSLLDAEENGNGLWYVHVGLLQDVAPSGDVEKHVLTRKSALRAALARLLVKKNVSSAEELLPLEVQNPGTLAFVHIYHLSWQVWIHLTVGLLIGPIHTSSGCELLVASWLTIHGVTMNKQNCAFISGVILAVIFWSWVKLPTWSLPMNFCYTWVFFLILLEMCFFVLLYASAGPVMPRYVRVNTLKLTVAEAIANLRLTVSKVRLFSGFNFYVWLSI